MGCRSYKRMLMSREDELAEAERELLAAHVAHCDDCAREAAEIAAMHRRLAAVRRDRIAAADPEQLIESVLRETPRSHPADGPLHAYGVFGRMLDLVISPVYRFAAAVVLLFAVGSGLWQAATISVEMYQLEDRQSFDVRAARPLASVAYVVDVQRNPLELDPVLVHAAGMRIEHGTLLVPGKSLTTIRDFGEAPAALVSRLKLSGREMHSIRTWKLNPAVQIRPVVSYRTPEGV